MAQGRYRAGVYGVGDLAGTGQGEQVPGGGRVQDRRVPRPCLPCEQTDVKTLPSASSEMRSVKIISSPKNSRCTKVQNNEDLFTRNNFLLLIVNGP